MSNEESVDELLAAAYALDGPDDSRALYAKWAATYESGFIVDSGYLYHEQVAQVFAATALADLSEGDVVVDIGCGTGLAGAALRDLGDVTFDGITLDGIDISPEMLGKAAEKTRYGSPVYRQLIEADLTQVLQIPSATYAGALSVGTFTHGHVGPASLGEVVRIIRPGGRVALGINAAHFVAAGFAEAFDRLLGDGLISHLQLIDAPIYGELDLADPDQYARIATFTVGRR